ncbi:uncharacterized protein LOC128278736 [Anopheles cruzii]|uniref:uncharacterized protein LOC128278736 n=1 Tax=Anopheles cruzii TaxID=68878 RepID=UPI0022EC1F8F|nr:uncharacterized protein LOC128278736 [Anopheles cruzii]
MIRSIVVLLCSTVITIGSGTLLCTEETFASVGGALPSATSCARYTKCVDGVVRELVCPDGQYFEVSSQSCTTAAGVECSARRTAFQFEELCTNPNDVSIVPHPTNCTQYIICYGLVPLEQSCDYGLLFNSRLGVCDIPTNVECVFSCPAVDDPLQPVWLPDPRLENCARHYLCFQGEPRLFMCESNLYFDMVTKTCTYPQYSGCRVPGVECASNFTELLENHRDCTSFYECAAGFPHLRRCAEDEYFEPNSRQCVVGTCSPGIETTTAIIPSTTTAAPITTTEATTDTTQLTTSTAELTTIVTESTSATAEPTTTTAELTTITIELTTITAEPTTTTVEPTTITAEPTTTTAEPTTITIELTTTTAEPTTTEPTTTIDPNEVCAGITVGVLEYPGVCYMYILCLSGSGVVSECAPTEIFNTSTLMCAPGNRDTCILSLRFGKL